MQDLRDLKDLTGHDVHRIGVKPGTCGHLQANTLAKLAGGLCDNLLTCVARAWSHLTQCIN